MKAATRRDTSHLSKRILAGSLVLLLLAGIEQVFAEEAEKFKFRTRILLFDATPTRGTGPVTSPDEAIPFADALLVLDFKEGDKAVISSKPDGKGDIVIDNFMTINGVNVCEGVPGQSGAESCFGPPLQVTDPVTNPGILGAPIDTVLTPIPPIDVSDSIPEGKNQIVLFELRDFGGIQGNTKLWFITTATVRSFP